MTGDRHDPRRRVRHALVLLSTISVLSGCVESADVAPITVHTEPVSPESTAIQAPNTADRPASPGAESAAAPSDGTEAPATGYQSFEGQRWFWVDWRRATTVLVRCARDRGFDVEATFEGDGITLTGLPAGRRNAAAAAVDACRDLIGLPSYEPATDEEVRLAYEYAVAVGQCLQRNGFGPTSPPPFEDYSTSWDSGPWDPHAGVSSRLALTRCPQTPIGGFGAWQPGDPVVPLP